MARSLPPRWCACNPLLPFLTASLHGPWISPLSSPLLSTRITHSFSPFPAHLFISPFSPDLPHGLLLFPLSVPGFPSKPPFDSRHPLLVFSCCSSLPTMTLCAHFVESAGALIVTLCSFLSERTTAILCLEISVALPITRSTTLWSWHVSKCVCQGARALRCTHV